jgi:hypothetical protein
MSHASGTVTFKDGLVLHFEYNGTTDVCIPALYETFEEMWSNWRNHERRECTCGNDEEVTIYASYGDGIEWKGKACRKCMCITQNLIPTQYQYSEDDYGWGY